MQIEYKVRLSKWEGGEGRGNETSLEMTFKEDSRDQISTFKIEVTWLNIQREPQREIALLLLPTIANTYNYVRLYFDFKFKNCGSQNLQNY